MVGKWQDIGKETILGRLDIHFWGSVGIFSWESGKVSAAISSLWTSGRRRPFGGPTSNHQPTNQPTSQPASQPASQPTSQPASHPTNQPTNHWAAGTHMRRIKANVCPCGLKKTVFQWCFFFRIQIVKTHLFASYRLVLPSFFSIMTDLVS